MKPLVPVALAVLGSLALAACSSTDPVTPGVDAAVDAPLPDGGSPDGGGDPGVEYRSGTRLRAKTWVSADGAKIIARLYDSQLKVDCTIATADDGAKRCLPVTRDASVLFTDSSCTKPVLGASTTCGGSQYGTQQAQCARTVFAPGAKSSATTLYEQYGATCTAYGSTPVEVYDLGPKQAASTFVKATRVREPRGAALMMESYDMEDGARMPIGAFDTARKSQCESSTELGFPAGRCVPNHIAFGEGFFAEATCTTAAALVTGPACDIASDDVLASAWVYGKKPSCNDESVVGFASVGSTVQTQAYQKASNSTCSVSLATGNFVPVTGDLPLTALPQMTLAPDGTGRIVRHVERAATGEKLLAERFYDTTLSAPCDALTAADGKLRCVPTGPSAFWYQDAACKQPIFAATDTGVGCAYDVPAWMTSSASDGKACPGSVTTSFKVGAKIASQATVYSFNGPTCQPNSGSAPWTLYGTTETPAASLAELTDVTE